MLIAVSSFLLIIGLIGLMFLVMSIIFSRRSQQERQREIDLENHGNKIIGRISRHLVHQKNLYLQYDYNYQDTMYQQLQQVTESVFNKTREGDSVDVFVSLENPDSVLLMVDRHYWKSKRYRTNARVLLFNAIFLLLLTIFALSRAWYFWSLAQGR